MNISDSPVKVALVGMPGHEQKRLHAAFNYSKTRKISYAPCELQGTNPAILMVNVDEPEHVATWRRYRNKLEENKDHIPSVAMVSKDHEFTEFTEKGYKVRRPLIASRVIGILDQIWIDGLEANNDIAIIADGSPDIINISDVRSTRAANAGTDKSAIQSIVRRKVLVVDDSLPVRIQMDQALRQFDTDVDFAKTGEEAFEYINSNDYDVIFLDVVLPGVDGYEICKAIKEDRTKQTPVIMLTGNSSSQGRIKGKLAGCDTYLIKPVGKVVFQEVVNQYL